jgi:hypothetical protein
MEILLFSLGGFVVVVLLMSVGVIFKRQPIRGSCGGIANVMGQAGCDACDDRGKCTRPDTLSKEQEPG